MTSTAKPPILPPALHAGDTIGLAPLAGPWQEEPFHQGIAVLRDFGFKIKILQHNPADVSFLAANDQDRADIFLELYKDPEVTAIVACRGGYGTMRLLPLLDFGLFREIPKTIIGFSDISALLNVITAQSGLITFHGPNLTTLAHSDKATRAGFNHLLTGKTSSPLTPRNMEIINAGKAHGQLVGGNLTTLTHLLATPYEQDWSNKIIFLEDVGEPSYRIDRLLSQLSLAGHFDTITGLILGQFTNCGNIDFIWQRIQELVPPTIPIWANLSVGHETTNHWLPIGLRVQMDSQLGELNLSAPFHS